MFRLVWIAVLSAILMLVSPAIGSAAQDYLDEAVQALQTDQVYVSLLVDDIDAGTAQKLEAGVKGSNVAVVVLPADAANEAGGNSGQFVAEIARRTGYDTIVVAFGNDLEAGSSTLQSGLANRLANNAENENGSTGDALLDFVAEVRTAHTHVQPHEPANDWGLLGWVLGIIMVLSGFGIGAGALAIRNKMVRRRPARETPPLTIYDELQACLEKLHQLANQISGDSKLRTDTLGAVGKTSELIDETRRLRPDVLDEKTQEFLTYVERLCVVFTMYLKAQNAPDSFTDQREVDSVKTKTRTVIAKYEAYVRRSRGIVGVAEMVDFESYIDLLTKSMTGK